MRSHRQMLLQLSQSAFPWFAALIACAVWATGVVLSGTAAGAGEPLTLVENGRAQSVILAAETISVSERFAVEEFRNFIQEISSVKLPVCTPTQAPPGGSPVVRIVVGRTTAEGRHKDLGLDKLGAEGFIIKTVGSDLVLAGGEQRGTLYSVYTFLETLGCRWWTDDESTIPRLETIRVPAIDQRELPPQLAYRQLLYREQLQPRLWGVRNKIANFGGEVPAEWGGTGVAFHGSLVHSWVKLLNENKQLNYEKRPELWALSKDGMRFQQQPCTSNPEVHKAIVEGALAWLREYPQDLFVTVGQDDYDHCHCKDCQARRRARRIRLGAGAGPGEPGGRSGGAGVPWQVRHGPRLCMGPAAAQDPASAQQRDHLDGAHLQRLRPSPGNGYGGSERRVPRDPRTVEEGRPANLRLGLPDQLQLLPHALPEPGRPRAERQILHRSQRHGVFRPGLPHGCCTPSFRAYGCGCWPRRCGIRSWTERRSWRSSSTGTMDRRPPRF